MNKSTGGNLLQQKISYMYVPIWGLMNGNWLLPRLGNRSTILPREYVSILYIYDIYYTYVCMTSEFLRKVHMIYDYLHLKRVAKKTRKKEKKR